MCFPLLLSYSQGSKEVIQLFFHKIFLRLLLQVLYRYPNCRIGDRGLSQGLISLFRSQYIWDPYYLNPTQILCLTFDCTFIFKRKFSGGPKLKSFGLCDVVYCWNPTQNSQGLKCFESDERFIMKINCTLPPPWPPPPPPIHPPIHTRRLKHAHISVGWQYSVHMIMMGSKQA